MSLGTYYQLNSPNPSRLPLEICKSTNDLFQSQTTKFNDPNFELTSKRAFYYANGNRKEHPEKRGLSPHSHHKLDATAGLGLPSETS